MFSCHASRLPKLTLDTSAVTVSGVSSGAYMASQLHIAHSDWVKGAGLIAGGPYYCAQNSLMTALAQCVNKRESADDLQQINQQLSQWQQQGKVAKLSHLSSSKVWLLHGSEDEKIHAAVTNDLVKQYQQWLPSTQLHYVDDKPFAHHFPTLNIGSDCRQSESPFLGLCQYDAAGKMLSFMLADINAPTGKATGNVYQVSQQVVADTAAAGLAKNGYVYVPKDCASGKQCQLHISFHGCNQNAEAVGRSYVDGVGLNRWADSNHLVVLYPQTTSSNINPFNPQGCWDWWGYTNQDYATNAGLQTKAVVSLVESLTK